jgi:acetylornithine/succinyldiaminopimelate/putrescine aminotransferase
MRTGELWGITKHGITPDILVIGKGISGGMYPISAVWWPSTPPGG